jgi:F0F1-type ATP synthase membrane subunit c/vacuolar-type H+-ATPase subunit K
MSVLSRKQSMFRKLVIVLLIALLPALALAEGTEGSSGSLASGIAFGLAALGGALAQGKALSSFMDSAGRNPGAIGGMVTYLIVGLVFIETLVIFGFVVALLK